MKTIIAIIGRIAAGKSTAIKLLKQRFLNNKDYKDQFTFIDLDDYCKELEQINAEINNFILDIDKFLVR